MESDSVRAVGDSVVLDLWIQGKFRAITVSRQAIEDYLQLDLGAAAMTEDDRREFVRTHLSLVVSAATARLREDPAAERIAIDQLGNAAPRMSGERRNGGDRRKGDRRKRDVGPPGGVERRS